MPPACTGFARERRSTRTSSAGKPATFENEQYQFFSNSVYVRFSVNDHFAYFDKGVSDYGTAGCS